ncbi:penicillin-binding protein 1C [Massilia atriviolacea]|uniref:peptidoglycan glycosyltransferase n=1 Tax=Massilia atriviolacea TaxID=2495579 RepID=A0A430HIE9_9BURK|nr:penicillin-binding protein 1C [Massilia atriviolacea]RSZ57282.1 penicillin-binding protein 1C [Massilia atriviolacea]
MRRLAAVLALAWAGQVGAVPTPEQVKTAYRASDVQLLDRHGVPIDALRTDMTVRRAPWVGLADISPATRLALVHAEDRRFMQHDGVDVGALGKAAWDNLLRTRARGASTITMQLAALVDERLRAGAGGRSWGQKWDQARVARELEAGWSKAQIMEAYLNLVPFRGELQGIGAASQGLFGKAPSGLNQAESAILASLLRAPSAAPRVVAQRACLLAREINPAAKCAGIEWDVAAAFSRPSASAAQTQAPHVAQRLLKGMGTGTARQVRSTLDAGIQRDAADTLRAHLAALRERHVTQGALVAIDNDSGEIVAYVANGGASEVDGVLALRQAGSTLKPFLYQLAMERGWITAASPQDDSPLEIATAAGPYVPQNYDRQFKGWVSTRTSLASSLNVPAVRMLQLTGLERFHARLRALGMASLSEPAEFYGFSLALGSGDVSLLELANAYRTLANGGLHGGVTLLPRAPQPKTRVLDAKTAFIVGDILSDRAARSLTFGLRNELATAFWSAVKTGTSKDMRDNWCVGYSEKYTVAVWVGNFDGSPMWDVSGVSGAAPVWRDVMERLHRALPSRAPAAPPGLVQQMVSYQPALEAPRREWFVRGTESAQLTLVGTAQRRSAIVYPGQDGVIALDPDIPAGRERVVFRAQGAAGLSWRLDGVALGAAGAGHAWQPVAGEHELALVDADDKVVATTRFSVRGAPAGAARP